MRRIFLFLLMSNVLTAEASAGLHFASPNTDLGAIRAGRRLTHRVWFSNNGDSAVHIVDVRGSCGCLHPMVSTKTLQPGAKAHVEMRINPFGQSAGKHRWRAFLRYAIQGRIEQQTLEVVANLTTEITIQPSSLTIYPANDIRETLRFIDLRQTPLRIVGANMNCDWLTVDGKSELKKTKNAWSASIALESNKPIPPGKHHLELVIRTDDAEYEKLYVPITVIKQKQNRLQALPSQIVLQTSGYLPFPSRLVRIRSRDNSIVKIDKIWCSHPAITYRWAPGPGRFTTIRIQADRTKILEKKIEIQIHVRTLAPVDETLVLNVTCVSE